jgi:hypothetical protein
MKTAGQNLRSRRRARAYASKTLPTCRMRYRMITGGLVTVPKNCIVEEIRKGREGAIQSGFSRGPPVGVFQNKRDIFGRDFPDTWIKKKSLVVEDEPRMKRI